jgi:hypothetical protein
MSSIRYESHAVRYTMASFIEAKIRVRKQDPCSTLRRSFRCYAYHLHIIICVCRGRWLERMQLCFVLRSTAGFLPLLLTLQYRFCLEPWRGQRVVQRVDRVVGDLIATIVHGNVYIQYRSRTGDRITEVSISWS